MNEPQAPPRLSVVVPTYRAPQLLAAALRSLAAQDDAVGLAEVVVVDDGSPGFDPQPLPAMASPLSVKVIHFDHNKGRSAARNAGIQAAVGAVVIFLDGDMTVEPGFLVAHDRFHRERRDCAAVGDIRWGPEVPDSAVTRYVASRGVSRFAAGPVPFNCFVTGNSSVPRHLLLALGGFDEGLSTYGGEDLELGCRLHGKGVSVHYLPEARSLHHGWRPLDGLCQAMETYGRHSLPRLMDRHPDLAQVLRLRFLDRRASDPRRWLPRLTLAAPLYGLLRRVAGLPLPLPDLVFDYLLWAARTRGYLWARGAGSRVGDRA